uniref:Uncharacterized protein n=1 Tax=viral metagenome TaxID=1070528 RepID=A0A6C0IDV7_9ZZZZ
MTFISLGVDCGTAELLRKLNLRHCSLPFDWVVTYEGITNIIKNDFEDYIPENHSIKNDHYGVLFAHNTFPQDKDKVIERIHRFKKILENNKEKITFIRKGHGQHHHGEHDTVINDIEDAIKFDSFLKQKYPFLKYEIHVILLCYPCFPDTYTYGKDIPTTIYIHNVAKMNVIEATYFDELCIQLFAK